MQRTEGRAAIARGVARVVGRGQFFEVHAVIYGKEWTVPGEYQRVPNMGRGSGLSKRIKMHEAWSARQVVCRKRMCKELRKR